MRRCEECGFDWEGDESKLGAFGDRYSKPLSRFLSGEDANAVLCTRPEPTVWSALEYAAYTRDVFLFYEERIRRALTEDRPQYSPLDPDTACIERRYNEEDPAETLRGLAEAERAVVGLVTGLDSAGWARVGIGVDGDERTVRELARRAEHDAHHHMLDIGRVLRRVRESRE